MSLKNRARPYISWSQYNLFRKSPEKYKEIYIYGKKESNEYMRFGREVADILEGTKKSDDPMIEHIKHFLPGLPEREFEISVNWEGIPLFGKLDGFDPKKIIIEENKTGKKWTQGMADKSEQLTFYSAMVWLKYNKIPEILLCWMETEWGLGNIVPTGKVRIFKTKRSKADIIGFYKPVKEAWDGIGKLCEKEYKSLIK
jgi:hypothetical protein